MKFSKKSRYGLIALVDLAVNSKYEQVALNSIADRNNISPQYLEQVFASLRRAGIVKSVKGSQGGYLLSRNADKITVAKILEALEGDYHVESEPPSTEGDYSEISETVQGMVINRINEAMDHILQNLTLEDLEQKYLDDKKYGQHMYYI